jgi:signal transduction histidine kinase
VTRLSALVESLLSVSRLAQGKLTLNPSSMDLTETIVQVVDGLREQAGKAGCELEVQALAPILGNWDRLRIEQVVLNLLVNAIKYGAGGPIEIDVHCADTSAVIEVSDHGPGVAEADLMRIFQRFERASSIRHYGGLGLGLYVSREIVEAHGGSITASNRPGGGAMFAVRLPANLPPSAARATPPEN